MYCILRRIPFSSGVFSNMEDRLFYFQPLQAGIMRSLSHDIVAGVARRCKSKCNSRQKIGCQNNIHYYRPVSVLRAISNFFEMIIRQTGKLSRTHFFNSITNLVLFGLIQLITIRQIAISLFYVMAPSQISLVCLVTYL